MECFQSINTNYYKGAIGAMIVFSLDNRDSFKTVTDSLEDLALFASKNIQIILIGSKSDLKDQ